jgi:EAL domain-containing protein (putative c-di-GMP-specific phosphodiesterase class I)
MNISPLQFRQRGFVHRLLQILQTSTLDPSLLQIEVTEGALTERIDDAITVLKQLHKAGIRIALDDFGVGSLSLAALGTLPIHTLKVDYAFVHRLAHDRASQAVTDAIISMGHALGMAIVGEGVEDEVSLDYLRAHGCHTMQGNLFSVPLPPDEFAHWLRARAH